MPQPPGWINEFNFIKSFWFNNCHHPATLYVEMAFQPTVHAADQLLAVDLPQIARTLFRPGGPRTKRHGRKRPPLTKKPYTKVPDPNESVAALLRDVSNVGDRVVADGPRFLWTLLDLGESVIGKFFIVGLIEQWLYEYALYIDAGGGSDCAIPSVRAEGGGTFTGNPGYAFVGGADAIWANGGADCFNGNVFMPTSNWVGVCSGTITNIGNGGHDNGPVSLRLGFGDGSGGIIESSATGCTIDFGESHDLVSTTFFTNGESVGGGWYIHQLNAPHTQTHYGPATIFCQGY